jgi:hypothetical protein
MMHRISEHRAIQNVKTWQYSANISNDQESQTILAHWVRTTVGMVGYCWFRCAEKLNCNIQTVNKELTVNLFPLPSRPKLLASLNYTVWFKHFKNVYSSAGHNA